MTEPNFLYHTLDRQVDAWGLGQLSCIIVFRKSNYGMDERTNRVLLWRSVSGTKPLVLTRMRLCQSEV